MEPKNILIAFLIYICLLSLISFFMYGYDKSCAKKGKDRIKEKNLLQSAIIGGAIGAFIGRIVFRHKTNKMYFSLVIIASILCEIGIIITCIVLM